MRLVARRNEKRSVQCQKSGRSSSNGGVDTKEKGSEEKKRTRSSANSEEVDERKERK